MGVLLRLAEYGEALEVGVDDDILPTGDLSLQRPLLFIVIKDGRDGPERDRSSLSIRCFLSQRKDANVIGYSKD